MDADTQGKEAFVTSSSLYKWPVMPFSLYLCQIDGTCFEGLVLEDSSFIYLDDVMVIGCTFEEELEQLKEMCEQLARAGLHLKPKKCFLFQKRVLYLGYVVTEEGIAAEAEKVEQHCTWPITEIKSFLGLASYYHRFIPVFSTIAKLLFKLTEAKMEIV